VKSHETGSRDDFRFFFINISSFVSKYFFDNKIISGEPCKGGSLIEKIISKDSEACRAGSLGKRKVESVLITLGIKSGNYTELHREVTELHREKLENYKQMRKIS